ncbi:MAG: AAA family ATPase [Deltaproteobacteria bacterium]|nr:AAA family ATPase [Deltaproteobacteria bacterium]MDL1960930.1 AAA family ATPase [Deltaproteobacteria bacterium]
MTTIVPLDPEKLRLKIDPQSLGFQQLSQLETEERPLVAQERAIQALTFGLRMEHPDFNIYVAGIKETGLSELARSYVEEVAKDTHPLPSDWCYVHNFRNPDTPTAIELREGKGREFKKDMADLLDELRLHIPKVFESETYVSRKEEVIKVFNEDRKKVFQELDNKVRENGFLLQSDQSTMMIVPAKKDGTALTPEDLSKMSQEERKELKAKSEKFQKDMADAMRRIYQLERSVRQRLKELDQEVVGQTVDTLLEPLKKKYKSYKVLQDYFADIREDVVQHMDDFRPKSESTTALPFPFPGTGPSFTRYEVNVLVDNSETKGAPVIIESNPSYPNLFGVVERKAQFGALFTDFTMIKSGAIHRANGGYLLIKALDLLKWPFSYEALKRALRNRKIDIEDPAEQFGLFTTKALKPKPIPLRIKIVLMGNPFIYQLLYNYDEDFRELFKVKAHLDIHVDRNEERLEQFMRSTKALVERENLRDMHMSGVASLIEFSSELAGSQEKLSLKISDLADLLREADFWAGSENSELIEAKHIQKAMDEKVYRCSLYEDHLHEMLKKDILKVSTTGKALGQVNGLSIYDLGDYMFGRPSRITVNIALGKEGVVNLEREADLSGSIHTKGVMILAGYLKASFAADCPLSLSASICFEQSYGMVEGDSASGAELFALLSALSDVPIDQGIAVTGAVSQKGEILPVGGVTRKIEGFFDLCETRNFTGGQGVIIPEANVKDLMLKPKVIDAVKQGKFQIWAISKVEEGLEILTGQPAGAPGPDGRYPEDSVFAKVSDRLRKLAEEAKLFMQKEEEKEKKH